MCGIAGIFAYHYASTPVDRDELRTIRDHMAARGPDGKGEWFADNDRVALGHRRLSIIDLSDRAVQPMASSDGQIVVSFNGEIYNYRELKRELESRGRVFRTESDTEVLLHLYADRGTAMLGDLRGMFAFALWDARKEAILLARDPYGIKPLYYADDGWTCRFASQARALLTSPKVSRLPEPAGLVGFYLFGSVPEPYTLYQEIRSVPAGSYQWIKAAGVQAPVQYCSIAQVWAMAEESTPVAPSYLREIVREAVYDSVRHHMVADVPVGAFLSAGIDSGALVGLMSEINGSIPPGANSSSLSREEGGVKEANKLRTLTLAFEEFRGTAQDEGPLAEKVARHYGVNHATRIVGEQEFRSDLPRILAAMDQPSIDGINTWFISKAAHESGLKVAVSGVGGDELFGGYPSFRDIPQWVRLLWLPTRTPGLGSLMEQIQTTFAPLYPSVNPKTAGLIRYGGTYPGAYLLRRGLFLPRELPALLGKELATEGLRRLSPLEHIRSQLTDRSSRRSVKSVHGRIAVLESTLYMRNQLLRDTDWASMAHSLEVRTPLVDATLLRRIAGPLAAAKAGNHKHLLASTPSKALPEEVASRAKSGFTTPIGNWQQRSDSTQAWRTVASLSRENCPWARRWCHVVAGSTTPLAR